MIIESVNDEARSNECSNSSGSVVDPLAGQRFGEGILSRRSYNSEGGVSRGADIAHCRQRSGNPSGIGNGRRRVHRREWRGTRSSAARTAQKSAARVGLAALTPARASGDFSGLCCSCRFASLECRAMDDPIPAGFITLPEALQRIAVHVSETHLEIAKAELQEKVQAIAAVRLSKESTDTASSELPESEAAGAATCGPSEEAWRHWNKQNFAVTKLLLALQTEAISAMVRDPDSGDLFRLTASDWRFEPLWEKIIRGGVIPVHASRGLEPHRQRTVLIETVGFEAWLSSETKTWVDADREDLCRKWLASKMRSSLTDKQKTKAQWFREAKTKLSVSQREFNRAWSAAIKETGANWASPGAPNKSSR